MGEETALSCPITADLGLLREHVRAFASAEGLSGSRLDDLVIAVNEAADNVLEHGGGSGRLDAWADDRGIWIDVADSAGTLTAGDLYRQGADPPPAASRGYGLWIIRRLCDEVVVERSGDRSLLRLHVAYPVPRAAAGETKTAGAGAPPGAPLA
ncbi:ATP-binding protein [Nonomuraea ferruginea]|uniref:ATP-binding protein n=1 Tax=Nonomuraea ferruginea TaxID=46174 RepID=A0ABT4T044_9ACTN|nr:ATP-binding protein [Nonomuraea ferruginea]MDA0642867.1 ATP-binding protein [Nonomuraea ferruginea]